MSSAERITVQKNAQFGSAQHGTIAEYVERWRYALTTMLETAFAEAAKLSPQEQDMFAAWMLEELQSERRWREAFAQGADVLAELADEALQEHRAGKTKCLSD